MLVFILGNEGFWICFETVDHGGKDQVSDNAPGLGWVGVLSVVPAALQDEGSGVNHLGEALFVFQQLGNKF